LSISLHFYKLISRRKAGVPRQTTSAGPRVEAYIKKAPAFAQPICTRLREIIFRAEPEIIEDWKWGPNYSKNGMVCGFGAFKQHVSLAFFQGAAMKDPKGLFIQEPVAAKNTRRIKLASLADLDEPTLIAYIKEAVALNSMGVKGPDRTIVVPREFRRLLEKKKLKKYFDSLAYTHRKEYVRWIESAKKEETRLARLKKSVQMLSQKIKHA